MIDKNYIITISDRRHEPFDELVKVKYFIKKEGKEIRAVGLLERDAKSGDRVTFLTTEGEVLEAAIFPYMGVVA